jgi:DNA-binding IscR family transcriptional regulator
LSWLFVLFGAHLAYSVQIGLVPKSRTTPLCIGPASRLAAAVARQLAIREEKKAGPMRSNELRALTGAHSTELRRVLEHLEKSGLIARLPKNGYAAARPVELLTLADVVRSTADLDADWLPGDVPQSFETKELFSQTEEAAWAALARTTWRELAVATRKV